MKRLGFVALITFATTAHAVVVRGTVSDPLGAPVAGARVLLVQNNAASAFAFSGPDGTYEIRSVSSGRFTLLTTAMGYAPSVSDEFYGGASSVLGRDLTMDPTSFTQRITVTATGLPTPISQTTGTVTLIPTESLATRLDLLSQLRMTPGTSVVRTGQLGARASLFVRGGDADANKVLVDGIPADDIGGAFDFGTVASTGLTGPEIYRGPDSAVYGSDALSSAIRLQTPEGTALKPRVDYSGDAGNMHTWRDELGVSWAHSRGDYYAAASRLDSSNALQLDRMHAVTGVANIGYALTAETLLRGTVRSQTTATGVPNAHDFFGVSAAAKRGDQDLYAQITLEDRRFDSAWHNLVRYGIARKREQYTQFYPVGTPITVAGITTYYGDVETIRGANGYTATGRAALAYGGPYPQRTDLIALRDEVTLQSDYTFSRHVVALATANYENERGREADPTNGVDLTTHRPNFQYTAQVTGDIASRVFLSLGGALEKNHLFGVAATPRFGIAGVPVRSGKGLRGTRLRLQFAKGVQEPTLAAEFGSLYGTLLIDGNTAAIHAYNVAPLTAQHSRAYDGGLDQNLIGERLILHVTYFHNEFDHQIEYVAPNALQQYFGVPAIQNLNGAYLNSLAYRAQGLEAETAYKLSNRLMLRGGYTWLDARVQRSFGSDAVAARQGTPETNPNIPGVAIGNVSPLVGNRPFQRPGNTGFLDVQYVKPRLTLALQAAFVGKADDSTYLGGATPAGDNTLLLPNQNLDFGYTRLDLGGDYQVASSLSVFAQLNNLLNDQHQGPIGYPSLPFTFRVGLKLRLGGE